MSLTQMHPSPSSGEAKAQIKPYISELNIHLRTANLAARIAADFAGREMATIIVLKGAFVFASDLLRRLAIQGLTPAVDFLRAASYGESDQSSGKVSLQLDLSLDLRGKDVLLIDDICDTGLTLGYLVEHIYRKQPSSVRTCVLVDKPSRRETEFTPDYIGFEIPNMFVVGYGLDYAEEFRCLPYIASLELPGS